MAKLELDFISDLLPLAGSEVYVTDWLAIEQDRVDLFARATDDHQWIHVDVDRARSDPAFGGTIAHGFLTLSLMARFHNESFSIRERRSGLNYGLNKVRFTAPVRTGSRVRGRATLAKYEEIAGGAQLTWAMTVEIEGGAKPACIAEWVTRIFR
jgi:acyl dehydratase